MVSGKKIDLSQAHSIHQADHIEEQYGANPLEISASPDTDVARLQMERLADATRDSLDALQEATRDAINDFGKVTSEAFGQIEANERVVNERLNDLIERMEALEAGIQLLIISLLDDKSDKERVRGVLAAYLQTLVGPAPIKLSDDAPSTNTVVTNPV